MSLASPVVSGATVHAAWVSRTYSMMISPLALAAGYFQKYGVSFDLTYINGSSNGIAGIVSHSLDMITASGSAVLGAQLAQEDLVMVLGFVNQSVFRVMAAPSVPTLADVKGKVIAVTAVGSGSDYFYWEAVAKNQGWSMSDLQFVSASDTPGQIAFLQTGQAQATIMSPPNNVLAEAVGAHEVFDSAPLGLPEVQSGLIVTRDFLANHRDVATGIAQACIETIHRWKTDPDFTKQALGATLPSDNPQFTDVGYAAFKDVFQEQPFVSRDGLLTVRDEVASQRPEANDADVDALFDNSVVQSLVDTGFIHQIYDVSQAPHVS